MRVFLTGGTGLIGSHAAGALRARGHEVTALVRPASPAAFLESVGAEVVRGDLADTPERLADGMRGCQAIVHAAALVYRGASWDEIRDANVGGTERVLRAATRAGAGRALHVSSIAVYGWRGEPRELTEDAWLEGDIPAANQYARSKREAELVAWLLHDRGDIRLTVIRPGVVYGERDRNATPVMARLASLPVLPLPGGGRADVPVVYAGNVAAALVQALEREHAVGRAYNLSADEPLTARRLLRTFGRALGREPRIVSVPAWLTWAAAGLGERLGGAVPGLPAYGLRRAAGLMLRGNPYTSARARQELDWGAHVSADEALRRTAAWWTSQAKTAPQAPGAARNGGTEESDVAAKRA